MPKKKNILICISIIILLAVGSIVYLVFRIKTVTVQREETLIEKQIRESEEIKKSIQPLTEEQIQQQIKESEAIKKTLKPLSEAQIKKQLEESNKLLQD